MTNELNYSFESATQKARQGEMELAELFSIAETWIKSGQMEPAIQLYRLWLESTSSPWAYVAYFNLGGILGNVGRFSEAEQIYRQAIALNAGFIQAYLNLGSALEQMGRQEEALEQWRLVLHLPVPVESALKTHALNNLGRLLEIMHQYAEAEAMLEQSLMLDPNQGGVIQHWVHLRQKQCKWPVFREINGRTVHELLNACSALATLGLSDDPAVQLAASRRFIAERVKTLPPPLTEPQGYGHEKLRIGYLSSNFCIHAVSLLTVELYELHDRSRVEVYGFCWSGEDKTWMLSRIAHAMDHYIRIAEMTDEEAAQCIRSKEIDILVDLQGLTSGTRPNILAMRPAPVQIAYLGYPGTTAIPRVDYVLADRYVFPEELKPYFTEAPLYLPNSFQISDRGREASPRPSRSACGLLENGFVFCCFNNNFKYTPEVFLTWMRILARVPDSVLWILADNEWARENLNRTAEQNGINPDRLLFAPRVTPPEYLARYQAADLFLDTYPFNGGTTANDALWMGLPLLTCSGPTFASRMAGSLLTALGLTELVTTDLKAYEEKAVELATQAEKIEALKTFLIESRKTSVLFDIPGFVRDLEDLYERVAIRQPTSEKLAARSLLESSLELEPELYQIIFSEENRANVEHGYRVMDNQMHERFDWLEYWPIRHFLLTTPLVENKFYGFFIPGFKEKTLLSFEAITQFIKNADSSVEVILFSHQPDVSALFKNVFESLLPIDRDALKVSQKIINLLDCPANFDALTMDSSTTVFDNYFVAKPRFWRTWLELTEKLFNLAEESAYSEELQITLADPISNTNALQRKVLLIRCMASLILSTQSWKTIAYDVFKTTWSTALAHLWKEAMICDALKIAFNQQGFTEYLGIYNLIRENAFPGK
jgi:predicted O-linked N-acetylglucosamine transferase (SPINDLY family)